MLKRAFTQAQPPCCCSSAISIPRRSFSITPIVFPRARGSISRSVKVTPSENRSKLDPSSSVASSSSSSASNFPVPRFEPESNFNPEEFDDYEEENDSSDFENYGYNDEDLDFGEPVSEPVPEHERLALSHRTVAPLASLEPQRIRTPKALLIPQKAQMKLFSKAKFLTSASKAKEIPSLNGLPEVIFAGRSNSGKSTLLNGLVSSDSLVKTSSRPGHTQMLNFFEIEGHFVAVDAPGYGARGRSEWGDTFQAYVQKRRQCALMVILFQCHHALTAYDFAFLSALPTHITVLPIFTKVDQLPPSEMESKMAEMAEMIIKARGGHAAWQNTNGTGVAIEGITGRTRAPIWTSLAGNRIGIKSREGQLSEIRKVVLEEVKRRAYEMKVEEDLAVRLEEEIERLPKVSLETGMPLSPVEEQAQWRKIERLRKKLLRDAEQGISIASSPKKLTVAHDSTGKVVDVRPQKTPGGLIREPKKTKAEVLAEDMVVPGEEKFKPQRFFKDELEAMGYTSEARKPKQSNLRTRKQRRESFIRQLAGLSESKCP